MSDDRLRMHLLASPQPWQWRTHYADHKGADVRVTDDIRTQDEFRDALAQPTVLGVYSGHGSPTNRGPALGGETYDLSIDAPDVSLDCYGLWLDACFTAGGAVHKDYRGLRGFRSRQVRAKVEGVAYAGWYGTARAKWGPVYLRELAAIVMGASCPRDAWEMYDAMFEAREAAARAYVLSTGSWEENLRIFEP